MVMRTVRLDQDSEQALAELVRETGLSISGVLKEGLLALRARRSGESSATAWDLYRELDLGPGGYASVPSTEVKQGVRDALRRKLNR
jgi:hypothetical protein